MKLKATTVAVLACALFAAACANTVRGVATDVKQTGQAVEEAVE